MRERRLRGVVMLLGVCNLFMGLVISITLPTLILQDYCPNRKGNCHGKTSSLTCIDDILEVVPSSRVSAK